MKMKIVTVVILAALSASSYAQYVGTLPPNAEVGFNYTTDSDKFTTNAWVVGAAISNGVGIQYGESRARGKDVTLLSIDKVDEKVNTVQQSKNIRLTYVNIGEDHDFHGSVGIKRTDSTVSGAGVQSSDSHDALVAEADLRLIMTDSLSVGITASRDVVDTAMNAASGSADGVVLTNANGTTVVQSVGLVIVDTAAVDLDLQLSDNLSTYAQVGLSHFSNNNDRLFVHSKTTYTILPEYGVSLYARIKYQQDSNPTAGRQCSDAAVGWLCVSPSYFSPDQRYSVLPGIQIRQAHDGLVYTASAEVGKQWTTVIGDTASATIYSWQLGVQTQPGKRTGNTFGVNLFGTNASQLSGSPNYHWYGLYSWMKVPF